MIAPGWKKGALLVAALSLWLGCSPHRLDPSGSRRSQDDAKAPAPRPKITASPTDLLQADGGRRIQDALVRGSYLPDGYATGRLDRKTVEALKAFQRDHGLPRTGFPDRETVKKLGLDPDAVFRAAESEAGVYDAAERTGAD